MATRSQPTLFLPHGAGPCFFMDWHPPDTWDRMAAWLRAIPGSLPARPDALLVVSAHWEAPAFTLNTRAVHDLLFDYSGFPPHTYELEWPARGAPDLASRIRRLIEAAGLPAGEEHERGLDHGVFIPLKVAWPMPELPVVQLSLRAGLDPAEHLALGHALAPLRDENVLIIGTGMSFHNMRRFQRNNQGLDPDSVRFEEWLTETVSLPAEQREARLVNWMSAPGARESHPREEHLLPLHVVAGAAENEPGRRVFRDQVLGSVQSAYRFGPDDTD